VERSQKKQEVLSLRGDINSAQVVIVVHYKGLTVSEVTKLRTMIRQENACFKVTKNSLARIAFSETGFKDLDNLFSGPTAIAFSKDPIAAAKAVVKFSEENEKLVLLGGMVGGTPLTVAGVKALANMPSLDELRAKIVGILSTPAQRIASVLQAPAGQIARVLSAYSKEKQNG